MLFMFWIGIIGGASFVNCVFLVLDSTNLEKKHKEVAFNTFTFFNNIAVLGASLSAQIIKVI